MVTTPLRSRLTLGSDLDRVHPCHVTFLDSADLSVRDKAASEPVAKDKSQDRSDRRQKAEEPIANDRYQRLPMPNALSVGPWVVVVGSCGVVTPTTDRTAYKAAGQADNKPVHVLHAPRHQVQGTASSLFIFRI